MEDITTLYNLPEVARLVDYSAEESEFELSYREIYMHIPTAAIVEVLQGKGHRFNDWEIYYEFTGTLMDGTKFDFTALLLNYNVPVLADRVFVVNKILKKVARVYSRLIK
ncbi:MAG: hypothetical protein IJZ22_05530 [Bacteroidaceae bacterium]|nr:hypothetical protein [Bacteroidaceae bacterium]